MRRTIRCGVLITGLLLAVGFGGVPSQAANPIDTLKEGRTYQYDLDGNGNKESLSYKMNEDHTIVITINGKTARRIPLEDAYYSPCIQVCDINRKEKGKDLWVYCYADSDDIRFSALYEYEGGDLDRVWKLKWDSSDRAFSQHCGKLVATDGKGSFTIAQDRAVDADFVIGNHWDAVKYRLKNGKVTRTSKKKFSIYEHYALTSDGRIKTNGALKTSKTLRFYKDHNKSSGSFTVKKGTKMYPLQAYIVSNSNIYVKFRTAGGSRTGWLRVGEFSWTKQPFSNMVFAD